MKEYKCSYKFCLHNGELIPAEEAILIGRNKYHWDCASMKQEIDELRKMYFEIDKDASFPIVAKVINDLIFKYNLEIGYIRFCLQHYIDIRYKFKSPFALLNLRKNQMMISRYHNTKDRGDVGVN